MAIVKMKKFKLLTFDNSRDKLLEELQKFSFVHFVETENIKEESLKEIAQKKENGILKENVRDLKWMIEYLKNDSPKAKVVNLDFQSLETEANKYDFQEDFQNLLSISKEREENKQEFGNLKNKKDELAHWTKIEEPLGNLKKFKKIKSILGNISTKNFDNLEEKLKEYKNIYFEKISVDANHTNLIFLIPIANKEEILETLKSYGFVENNFSFEESFETKIKEIEDRKNYLEEREKELSIRAKKIAENYYKMQVKQEYLENIILRGDVTDNFKKTESIDVIEGYVPEDLTEKFEGIVDEISENKNHLEFFNILPSDTNTPIILKNSKFFKLFETITQMYALPKYNEIDPTPVLSVFYWFFFGMMVADFAYGLLLCIGSAAVLNFCKLKETHKKFLKFFFALSFSTMIWGLIYGSAFGDLLHLPTQILDPSKDFMRILILSIIFGGVHLVIALAMKGYIIIKNGSILDAFYDVFLWYLTLAAIILLILSSKFGFSDSFKNILLTLMGLGMIGIVAFSARDAKTLAGRIGGGLYSLYGITSYIGDFVSYLRLMALGLAGGFIAVAINIIVRKLMGAGIIGLIFGLIVFALGQSFNIFLSLLSSYVHTSRLIYVEFFSKFYEGGGKAFKKFRVDSKYFEME